MAWKSFGDTSAINVSVPSSSSPGTTRSTCGAWVNRTPISRSTVLNSDSGILFDITGIIGLANLDNPLRDPSTLLMNYAIATSLSFNYEGFVGDPIPLAEVQLILCNDDPKEYDSLSDILNNSHIITSAFSGDKYLDTVGGYSHLYISGSGSTGLFPEYIVTDVTYSYCYAPSLIVSVSDINNYIANGYVYPGIYVKLSKLLYTQTSDQSPIHSYAYSFMSDPNSSNVAAMINRYSGIKVKKNNAWLDVTNVSVKMNNAWQPTDNISIKMNSQWNTLSKTREMVIL